jgi:hypothetical protein
MSNSGRYDCDRQSGDRIRLFLLPIPSCGKRPSTRGWNISVLESVNSFSRSDLNRSVNEVGHVTSLINTMVQGTKIEGQFRHSQSVNPSSTAIAGPSQAEQLLRVTSGIAAELIKAHDANESVSLNEIRARISKKYAFGGVPRLVDIISAIPDEYKKALLPKLKARPIRTASGVRGHFMFRGFETDSIR